MKSPALVALLLVALVIQSPFAQTGRSPPDYVPGELIIEYQPGASDAQQAEVKSWVGAVRRQLHRRNRAGGPRNGGGNVELARVSGGALERALAVLRSHPAVRFAEPNWVYRRVETSDDPHYTNGDLWGMLGDATTPHANAFGSQAGEAWQAGHVGSASIAVGIIDEGIQITHPDLAANIWTNPVEAAGIAGVDDDGNGYVDDIHGWDFVSNDNSVYDGVHGDDHGTHVAGTVGAVGGNGVGVAGVNWYVTLIPAKFLVDTGSAFNAIRAIDYITDLKTRHHLNIVATNNSWGGRIRSEALLEAIVRGAKADILFVAAAGNDSNNNDSTPFYPTSFDTTAGAGYDAVISVAAITNTGVRASFSNYGKTSVDLGAPGQRIWSTLPDNTYAFYHGTSMAAPHVTGAAALYASLLPAVSARRIKEVILASATATPTATLATRTVTGGRLNIGEFAGPNPLAPTAPGNLAATAVSSHRINLTWTDMSTTEDGFQVDRCQGAGCSAYAAVAFVDEDVIAFSDTAPSAQTLYRYRVKAYNRGGASSSGAAQATTLAPLVPSANAGADLSVYEAVIVTLDGTQSSHPENVPLSFAWTQTAGTSVALTGANTSRPAFTAPAVGVAGDTLTFILTVTADGVSATGDVDVTVINVNAAPAITSAASSSATEDVLYSYAAAVSDTDGPAQTWSLLSAHTCGGAITAASGAFHFTPAGPVPPASCVVAIQVCDGGDPNLCAAQTATVTIAAVNDLPTVVTPADIVAVATSTSGVAVSFTATGSDPEDGPRVPACTPASGSTFRIGTTTVPCVVTDSAGAKGVGSFTVRVTVTAVTVPGEMKGGGVIRDDEAKYSFSFEAREQAFGERAHLAVRIDGDGRKIKGTRDDRFASRSVDYIAFSDNPAIAPGRASPTPIDTVLFMGVGAWNGRAGYRYEVFAQDAGEPGRHRESIRVTIWDPAGAVVASFAGDLVRGSIRSLRINH